jgi:hypothetical protein
MLGSLNPSSGYETSQITVNGNPSAMMEAIDVTITIGSVGVLIPQNGAVSLKDLLSTNQYQRILTYTFSTGEQLTFNSSVNFSTLHAETQISGSAPANFNSLYQSTKSITLVSPVTCAMINSTNGQGIEYSGVANYNVGGTVFTVTVSSKYIFTGKRLPAPQKFIFSGGATTFSGNVLTKTCTFQLTK